MAFKQVTIIGTGLIGGSFALGMRKHGFTGRIVGCDRPAVLERASARGAIEALDAKISRLESEGIRVPKAAELAQKARVAIEEHELPNALEVAIEGHDALAETRETHRRAREALSRPEAIEIVEIAVPEPIAGPERPASRPSMPRSRSRSTGDAGFGVRSFGNNADREGQLGPPPPRALQYGL